MKQIKLNPRWGGSNDEDDDLEDEEDDDFGGSFGDGAIS